MQRLLLAYLRRKRWESKILAIEVVGLLGQGMAEGKAAKGNEGTEILQAMGAPIPQ